MKIVITGGLGFLGTRLAAALLERGRLIGPDGTATPISNIVLFDHVAPNVPPFQEDSRVSIEIGDISRQDTVNNLITPDVGSVFHLASIVSGEGEVNFDGAMAVNLDGGRHLMETLRACSTCPTLVATSSLAGYGGELPSVVGDATRLTPQTTYGTTKAIMELLINDYSRKGFLDGRTARLPTVIIRPGKPNAAASSFFSGVFREPLQGLPCALPVSMSQQVPVTGYRAVIDDLVRLHDLPAAQLGSDRSIGFHAVNTTVGAMVDAVECAGGANARTLISVKPDVVIDAIVSTWPTALNAERAAGLGLTNTQSLDQIVRDYMSDYGNALI